MEVPIDVTTRVFPRKLDVKFEVVFPLKQGDLLVGSGLTEGVAGVLVQAWKTEVRTVLQDVDNTYFLTYVLFVHVLW